MHNISFPDKKNARVRRSYLQLLLYAGGSILPARLSGINTAIVKITVFIISGLMVALSGVILASRLGSGQPNCGVVFELDVIAVVVVGETCLMGGRGTIMGSLVEALIVRELSLVGGRILFIYRRRSWEW